MHRDTMHKFCFESFGVRVRLESANRELLDRAVKRARKSLVLPIKEIGDREIDHVFTFGRTKTLGYYFDHNGKDRRSVEVFRGILIFFDSLLRVSVAESAGEFVFIHAGVVEWHGKAIVIPGDSFTGKSTLVSELIKLGAGYYSDEFAILDADGKVNAFPRPINMRKDDGKYSPYVIKVNPERVRIGGKPLEIGTILFTSYKPGAEWKPKHITPGQGLIKTIPFTLPIKRNPEFTMYALNKAVNRALIIETLRSTAQIFSIKLLNYIDTLAV